MTGSSRRVEGGRSTDARPRVLVLGWHGSRERHLRPIARTWETLGAEPHVVVPDTWRAMSFPHGWPRLGERLLADLERIDPRDADGRARPWLAHAFSNAGFWSLAALLDAAAAHDPGRSSAHLGTVLDSAPGFPERVSPFFTARFASMAMTPSILAALGQKPRETHPLVTPPLALFLGLWHLVARDQVRFMETSQARFIAHHAGKSLLGIWGGADRLVLARYVTSFLERAERGGVRVERRFFPTGAHVRHFIEHRSEVAAALGAFLANPSIARP